MAFAPWPGCVKSWATSSRILCLRVLLSKWENENGKESALLRMLQSLNMHKANMVGKGYMCVCVQEHIFYIHNLSCSTHDILSIYIVYTICQCSKHGDLNHGGLAAPKIYPLTSSSQPFAFLTLATYSIVSKPVTGERRFVLEAKQRPENQHLDKVQ